MTLTDRAEKMFRDIAAGTVHVVKATPTWGEAFCQDVAFDLSDGTKLVIFKRHDRWKYTDSITFADGTKLPEKEDDFYVYDEIDERLSDEDHDLCCRNLGMPIDEWKAEDKRDNQHMEKCGLNPEDPMDRSRYYLEKVMWEGRQFAERLAEAFKDREDVTIKDVVEHFQKEDDV